MQKPNHDPTRREIRAECWKIQSEWSEDEKWKRMGYQDGRPILTVPRVGIRIEGRRL